MRHDLSPDRFQRYYVPKNKVPVAVFSAWRIDISKSQNSAIGHGSAKAHLPACGSVTSVFNTEQRRPTALLTVPRLRKVCVESHFTHHALTLPIHNFDGRRDARRNAKTCRRLVRRHTQNGNLAPPLDDAGIGFLRGVGGVGRIAGDYNSGDGRAAGPQCRQREQRVVDGAQIGSK